MCVSAEGFSHAAGGIFEELEVAAGGVVEFQLNSGVSTARSPVCLRRVGPAYGEPTSL
jgi:hypothetical protein